MSDYFTLKSAIIEEAKNLETTLPIKNEACRPKFFLHSHPTSKVCLFFHGFTAGPYQFEPIGKVLFEIGYNVLIPLQPGHGIAGDWNQENPPPLPTEAEVYQQFALSWLKVALSLGQQVVVGGLSSGGTLAAWLGLECPQQIEKAILFAPYLSQNPIVDLLVEVLSIYYEWPNKDNPGNFGYKGFRMPALRLFLNMGKELLEKVENHPAVPMFVISSDSDRTVDKNDLEVLFASLIKQQSKSWYHRFDKLFEIPHTMMTKAEGNQYKDLLIAVAKSYLESDITWNELLEVGHQILTGKNFDTVINELQITSRVAPDVSVLLTVMDKKTIIDAYYLLSI